MTEHEHVFEVAEVHLLDVGADTASTCTSCGAVAYAADRPDQEATRPRLDDAV